MFKNSGDGGGGVLVLLGILGGGVTPGQAPNFDSISLFHAKTRHFLHPFSDLASKILTSFRPCL